MFGRQIDVVFIKPSGEALVVVDHNKHPNTYRCQGSFERYDSTECDKLELSVFNLPAAVRGELALGRYEQIIVRYGYADENNLGELFIGNIQRMITKKPDEVSLETKIWVYDTGQFKATTFFSATYANGVNYYQIAQELCKRAKEESNIQAVQLSEKLKDYAVYCSKSFYNSSDVCMQEIAQDTGLVYKKSNNSLLLLTPEEIINQTEAIVFSVYDAGTGKVESRSGMIGIPQLTDTGLELDCLINTRLRVFSLLQIDNSSVSIEQEGAIPSAEYGAMLDPDGLYVITSMSGTFSNDGQSNSIHITALARSLYLDMHKEQV